MALNYLARRMAWFAMAPVALALAGCGADGSGGTTATGVSDTTSIRAMSELYGAYLREHKNKPPTNEQDFRDFLATQQEQLQQDGLSVDEIFVSPRSKEPLQWVYGRTPPTGPMGMMFIAFEKSPVDGKRLVIATRGMHELMDEAKFRSVFPKAE